MVNASPETQTEQLDPQQQLEWCLSDENLGQRITTVGLGETDARTVAEWVTSGVPEIRVTQLGVLYGAAQRISAVFDSQTARAFMRSSNEITSDDAPVQVIARTGIEGPEGENARQLISSAVGEFVD